MCNRPYYVCMYVLDSTGKPVGGSPGDPVVGSLDTPVRRDPVTGGGDRWSCRGSCGAYGGGLRYPFHFRLSSVGSVSVELQVSHQFSERAGWSWWTLAGGLKCMVCFNSNATPTMYQFHRFGIHVSKYAVHSPYGSECCSSEVEMGAENRDSHHDRSDCRGWEICIPVSSRVRPYSRANPAKRGPKILVVATEHPISHRCSLRRCR